MSELVTNAEIEDVLSSIRRLVSEDIRPAHLASRETKLVLTPAFRVHDPDHPQMRHPNDEAASATDDSPASPALIVLEVGDDRDGKNHLGKMAAVVKPDTGPAQKGPSFATLEQTIAELEAAISQQDIDWEPDGSESAATGLDPLSQDWADTVPPRARPDSPTPPEQKATSAPDITTTDAEEKHLWHHTPVPTNKQQDDAIEDAQVLDSDGFLDCEPSVIDEDTLHDMVSEIVRTELQGDLGQRITRNVRKLVRREIQRALASRDFD